MWPVLPGGADKGALSTLSHLQTSANPITINNMLNTTYFQLWTPLPLFSRERISGKIYIVTNTPVPSLLVGIIGLPAFKRKNRQEMSSTEAVYRKDKAGEWWALLCYWRHFRSVFSAYLCLFSQRNLLAGKTNARWKEENSKRLEAKNVIFSLRRRASILAPNSIFVYMYIYTHTYILYIYI